MGDLFYYGSFGVIISGIYLLSLKVPVNKGILIASAFSIGYLHELLSDRNRFISDKKIRNILQAEKIKEKEKDNKNN